MRIFLALLLALTACASPDDPSKTAGDGRPAGDSAGGDSAGGGDDATPGDPVVGPIAAEDMCTWITEIFCQADQECCTDGSQQYGAYDQCVASEGPDCESSFTPIFTDTRTGYDEDIAGERVTEMRIKAASCELGIGEWMISDDGLFGALLGTVGPGGDCSPEGGIDLAVAAACTGDNVCSLTAVFKFIFEGECQAASGSGGGCYTDFECDADLHCFPEENWLNGGGTCIARLADGQFCDVDGDCLSLTCDTTLEQCAPVTANSAYCAND